MHFNEEGCVVPRSRSSSVGHRSRHNSQSSSRAPGELPKQMSEELTIHTSSLKNKDNSEQLKRLNDQHSAEGKFKSSPESAVVDYSHMHRVSDNFRGTSQFHLLNSTPVEELNRCLTSCTTERSGVDTSSTSRVSDNFISNNLYNSPNAYLPADKNSRRSVSPYRDRSGVDTNFESSQHLTLNAPQTRKQKCKERSGVDTTSVSKVSDNLVKSGRSRKSSASVNDLDLITKKEQNDSGSEISDEGYKSLSIVTTPPANVHQTNVSPLLGKLKFFFFRPFLATL
jgi:hypothetical protein